MERLTTFNAVGSQAEQRAPLRLALRSLIFPVRRLCLINILAGVALGLIGAPILAAGWGRASCAADAFLQRRYGAWSRGPAPADETAQRARLAVATGLRAELA